MHRWYHTLLLTHAAAFLAEALACGAVLAGIVLLGARTGLYGASEVLPAMGAAWSMAALVRLRRAWRLDLLFAHLHARHPRLGERLGALRDLLCGAAHAPDEGLSRLAAEQMSAGLEDLPYPWRAVLRRPPVEYAACLPVLLLPALVQGLAAVRPSVDVTTLRLVPPAYLGLPECEPDPAARRIEAYPGSLLICEVRSERRPWRLGDDRGGLFLPLAESAGGARWEVRLMEDRELVLSRAGREVRRWEVGLVPDQPPAAAWEDGVRASTDWGAVQVAYRADDDVALGDAFVVVDGRELEYAGSPAGRKAYRYGWTFDPLDHIRLEGGQTRLQVTVYDQDRVRGPKSASTGALVWQYDGVEKSVRGNLAGLERLLDKMTAREADLSDAKDGDNGQDVEQGLDELDKGIRANPVLPEHLAPLARRMLDEYRALRGRAASEPRREDLRREEAKQLARDRLYLDHVRTTLKDLLSTASAADLVARLEQAARGLEDGAAPSAEEMDRLYEDLERMLEDSAVGESRKQEILKRMEQAQLLARMGRSAAAAAALRETAEAVKQAAGAGGAGDSQLAARFQEAVRTLDGLIARQAGNAKGLREDQAKAESGVTAWRDSLARISRVQQAIMADPRVQGHVGLLRDLQARLQAGDTGPETQALARRIQGPQGEEQKGRDLFVQYTRLQQQAREMSQRGVERPPEPAAQDWLPPEDLAAQSFPEQAREDYRVLHRRLRSPCAEASLEESGFSRRVREAQGNLARDGAEFAAGFRDAFAMIMPGGEPFLAADQASINAAEAARSLSQANPRAAGHMAAALGYWQTLREMLARMQQQAASSGMGAASPLSIGRDGKMRLRKRNAGSREGMDGQLRAQDMEIALPEDFRKAENIEKRMREEMKTMPEGETRELFKSYMLDLLE